jgi:hypothetical protein
LVCGLNDVSLRIAVEEKARAFGCAEAISNLAIIDAVRFLQHRERCTPCFGWESPLIPLSECARIPAGIDREKVCGVLDCYWKSPCDTHRIMPTASLEECMDEELVSDMEAAIREAPASGPAGAASAVEQSVLLPDPVRRHEAIATEKRSGDEQAAAQILNRMAESAGTFLAAVRELVQQGSGWSNAVGQQLDGLTRRFDELAEVVFGQQVVNGVVQERYEELCQAVAATREADARHQADVQALREGTRERMDWFSARLEELSSQQALQRQDFSGLQAQVESLTHLHVTVAELSTRVEGWCKRLDRQGEALHTLWEAQNQRTEALDQVVEVLNRLRAASTVPAVQI